MERTEASIPADASPDPPQDHPATTLPNNIEALLHACRVLLGYGRHLFDTIRHRATAPNFNAIAACFGTANLTTILAHLNRGILRATALERVLLARAATGRDFDFVERHTRTSEAAPAATEPQPAQLAAIRKPARRESHTTGLNDPELYMPTLDELERQVRRRPIGRTVLDICLDLAVVPGFCHSAFWSELTDILICFGGGIHKLMRKKARRQHAFLVEQDRAPDANWDWLRLNRNELRQVLGFFIGEPPVNPLDPAAAIATAPP